MIILIILILHHPGSTSQKQIELPSTDLNIDVVHISDKGHKWQIPCFPVLIIDFVEVKFLFHGSELEGLMKQGQKLSCGSALCTSHCSIKLSDNKSYTVLWEIGNVEKVTPEDERQADSENDSDSSDSSSEETSDQEIVHSLPFKVLGSAYCKEKQKALSDAQECLYEYNRPVFVELRAEPDNVYDRNAIAVYIMSDDTFKKVGYIASELTRFVHPHLRDTSFSASVLQIKYRTTFQLMGHYMSISLTKKGLWHNQVVRASKNVK